MQTELLIIKNKTDYIRVKKDTYIICNLDKASVFPMEMVDQVKDHVEKLKKNGYPSATVYKLMLTEELFMENLK